jgi:aspartate kinase
MQVFKFGGASVKDALAIQNVANILQNYRNEKLVIIISAMGKTTNALEAICEAYSKQNGLAHDLLDQLRVQHRNIVQQLFDDQSAATTAQEKLATILDKITKRLNQAPLADYNFLYDQIVSTGELLSTTLIADYLATQGLPVQWLDVRHCILTDNTYREAKVNWSVSPKNIQATVKPIINEGKMVVTQGFLGGTIEKFTTTLGREGSDFTAAIFAHSLDANSMSVWKDVPGILSADPRLFADALKIPELSYYEAIEMTYYGAKVIHPKTIKPLQNKGIPLIVRSFSLPHETGTIIHHSNGLAMPPVVVINKNQLLLSITTKDFSFIAEENLSRIYQLFAKHHIKINLSQNAAISFSVCIDNVPYKVIPLINDLSSEYKVVSKKDLQLLTIRHHTPESIERHSKDLTIVVVQKSKNTVQWVIQNT